MVNNLVNNLDTLKEIADYAHEKDIEEIKRYLACLDDMEDYLDNEDEIAGLPSGVFDAFEKLQEYFSELYQLRTKPHRLF
jgi:hypothetical protein